MEVAFYLVARGLFRIPDVGILNQKQAKAFLYICSWLQRYMIDRWVDSGEMPPAARTEPDASPDFELVLLGPGGTGKTAVLKAAEAIIDCVWLKGQR